MINGIAPDVRTHVGPPSDGRRARAGFWLAAAVYALVVLGGTLPIPLYAFRVPRMGFGPFTATPVFAVYAVGAVLALMLSASLTDRAGRPPGPPLCWPRRRAPCCPLSPMSVRRPIVPGPRRRADPLSTYFLFAYPGTSVPTLVPRASQEGH
ncbi:hypothetical protein [Streptomyces olivaceoviridis]|uniref:hypothetical protein n=1 Tax=Streptomyces olivaceoviridis TaxID=1921 RepID=UPI00379BCA14